MKKQLSFVLIAAVFAFAAAAADVPAPVPVDAPSSLETPILSTLDCAGSAGSTLGQQTSSNVAATCEPEIDCSQYETAFCSYAWTCDGCCTPTYIAPGRNCFPICIR
jgi:hypothetical protein